MLTYLGIIIEMNVKKKESIDEKKIAVVLVNIITMHNAVNETKIDPTSRFIDKQLKTVLNCAKRMPTRKIRPTIPKYNRTCK